MKHTFRLFICLWIILTSLAYAENVQQKMPITANEGTVVRGILVMPGQFVIASKGETVVVAKSAKFNAQVKIRTHEVQIGKPSEKRPDVIRSSCTYSRYPCSVVDGIDIFVNGEQIFVPRSVFCDLADLNTAEIKIGQKESILTLHGGDASESYFVKIEFDAQRVKCRRKFSSMAPDKASQETVYRRVVIGEE